MRRKQDGYTLIELMISITLLAVVLGLIYANYNRGYTLFNKALQFGRLQTDARSALEQMANNIKQANKGMIYVGDTFNSDVPLPKDYAFGKPFIYFAVPLINASKPNMPVNQENKDAVKSGLVEEPISDYDYYLYYVAYAKDKDGNYARDRAKLKLLRIKNQDGNYTLNAQHWPIMAPSLIGRAVIEEEESVIKISTPGYIEYDDLSDEFSLYHSEFAYYYYNSNYDNLFTIKVKLIDPVTDSKMEFETSVTPRN